MPNENGKEFLQKFITENEGSWRERQLARKEERMRVRREAAEKAADLCEQVELLANIVKMPDGVDPGDLPLDRVRNLREYLYD